MDASWEHTECKMLRSAMLPVRILKVTETWTRSRWLGQGLLPVCKV